MVVLCTPCNSPPPLASVFTWEVKANDRAYNNQFKEKAFLCWQRKKYKVGGPAPLLSPASSHPAYPLPQFKS